MKYIAHRSLLIDGRMYAKGDIIETAMKRGKVDLFVKTKAISVMDESDECKKPIVTTPVEATKTIVPPREVAPKPLYRKKA